MAVVGHRRTHGCFLSLLGRGVPTRNGGGIGVNGNYGTLYGHKITQQEYINARNEFYLFYWFRNNEWPDRNPNFKDKDLEEQIYLRLMLTQKAGTLGIHVPEEATAAAAGDMLRSPELLRTFGLKNGQSVPIDAFVKQVLQPENLTADDFERFARNDVVIQQLIQTLGLAGNFVTPQEAAAAYQREHQEVSAQIVFFSASNFVSQVTVTPAAVGQFYTNYLAQYRLPDRVQVNYVEFNVTNFLAQSKAEWAKTNFDENVNAAFQQYGMDAVPDAKTPDEAKAKIRDALIRQRALADARAQANDFATAVFNTNPLLTDNLAAVAKQKGLTVASHRAVCQPRIFGPDELHPPDAFIKAAFALTSDDPFAGPVIGTTCRLCDGARQTIAQRNPVARPDPRPRHAGFSDGASHPDRAARRDEFRRLAARTTHGRPQFRVSLHRRRLATRNTAAIFLEHAGIAGTRQPRRN